MSRAELFEREFLTAVGHGRCSQEIMSEALAELLQGHGCHDAARVVARWIDNWAGEFGEHSEISCADGEPSGTRIALELAQKAFERGEPEIARGVIEDFLEGRS